MNIKERAEDTKQLCGSTFLVKVLFTQNASMQGFVQWIEKEKTLPFRSCFELFHLMEAGLEIENREGKGRVRFRSWE